jgi:outer membrane protein
VKGVAVALFLGILLARAGAESLDLTRAMELAKAKADEVTARNAALEAALKSVDAARALALPKLGGTATGAYLFNPSQGLTVAAGSLGTLPLYYPGKGIVNVELPAEDLTVVEAAKPWYVKGEIDFSQPIFAWGKIRSAIDIATLEADVARIQARGASLDAARQANRAYYSTLLSRRSFAILAQLRDLAAQIAADAKSALGEGLSTRAKLLSAEADLADLEAKLVEARESEHSSLEALSVLTGIDCSSLDLVSDFRDTLPPLSEAEIRSGAASSSTAFGEARTRLSEAKRKLDLEGGSGIFKPDLSLFASFDAANQDAQALSSSFSWNLSLGLAAKVDFFDGGAARGRTRSAAANVAAAEAALTGALDALRLDVRRAVDAARRGEASLAASRAREAWAAEALKAAEASAGEQIISRPELNAARIGEASARLATLSARYSLEEAIADLERLGLDEKIPR